MTIAAYNGYATGARAEWRGRRFISITIGVIDRHPPEGATWTLRFSPRRTLKDKALAERLSSLATSYHRKANTTGSIEQADRFPSEPDAYKRLAQVRHYFKVKTFKAARVMPVPVVMPDQR